MSRRRRAPSRQAGPFKWTLAEKGGIPCKPKPAPGLFDECAIEAEKVPDFRQALVCDARAEQVKHAIGMLHRAVCLCGYLGPLRGARSAARADVAAHLVAP